MTRFSLDRRSLLVAGGAGFAASLYPRKLWARPSFSADPFALGVAAGDPWPDGFVIWTRLAPHPLEEHGGMPAVLVPVRWEVAEDEGFASIVASGEAIARPELAHAVHVEVSGLRAHRHYWYRFHTGASNVSMTGLARTAPRIGDTPSRVRIGVAGCQHYETGYYTAFRRLAEEPDLDLVFHYGDYIYEREGMESNDKQMRVRKHVGHEIYSLDDYRRRYAQYKSDEDLKAAHAAAAFVSSFDDHEVDNNWAAGADQDGTPPEIFALRRAAAMQAWYEHMPVRAAQFPRQGSLKMYRRLDYGTLLRMHVLDTRSYRADQLCDYKVKRACETEDSPDRTMLGAEQEQWLASGLDPDRRWNLIAQQKLMMPFDRQPDRDLPAEHGSDGWDGYRGARRRLAGAIKDRQLTNVVVSSGDAHRHYVGSVPLDDEALDGPAIATEFLSTSITSGGDGDPEPPSYGEMLRRNPHFALVNSQRGYQLFDIQSRSMEVDIKVVEQVTSPGSRATSFAKYTVDPARPGPQKN